jgi:hypothetical protein
MLSEGLQGLVDAGAHECDKCGSGISQRVQHFHKDMGEDLRMLVFLHDKYKRPVHTRELRDFKGISKASIDMVQLKHWGLIETRGAGWYEPTDAGRSFVAGKIEVPAWVRLVNNKPARWADRQVDMGEVLGTPFDYQAAVAG